MPRYSNIFDSPTSDEQEDTSILDLATNAEIDNSIYNMSFFDDATADDQDHRLELNQPPYLNSHLSYQSTTDGSGGFELRARNQGQQQPLQHATNSSHFAVTLPQFSRQISGPPRSYHGNSNFAFSQADQSFVDFPEQPSFDGHTFSHEHEVPQNGDVTGAFDLNANTSTLRATCLDNHHYTAPQAASHPIPHPLRFTPQQAHTATISNIEVVATPARRSGSIIKVEDDSDSQSMQIGRQALSERSAYAPYKGHFKTSEEAAKHLCSSRKLITHGMEDLESFKANRHKYVKKLYEAMICTDRINDNPNSLGVRRFVREHFYHEVDMEARCSAVFDSVLELHTTGFSICSTQNYNKQGPGRMDRGATAPQRIALICDALREEKAVAIDVMKGKLDGIVNTPEYWKDTKHRTRHNNEHRKVHKTSKDREIARLKKELESTRGGSKDNEDGFDDLCNLGSDSPESQQHRRKRHSDSPTTATKRARSSRTTSGSDA